MKKVLLLLSAALLIASVSAASATALDDALEGCAAVNPGQPKCSFTAEGVDTFGGVAGHGKWVVKVKVGKRTTSYKSPASGEPNGQQFMIPAGAKVTATAISTGSGLIVGGE